MKGVSGQLKAHARGLAEEAGRPYLYLQGAHTKRSRRLKEDLAREIAARDGVSEGLICALSAVEPCSSFEVAGNRQTRRLEVVRRRRKCLHFYFYFLDPDLGLVHVRLQSWFPFEIQVYMNGREILARQLQLRMGVFAALDQRIGMRYCIPAMDLTESAAYLRHHLGLVGRTDALVADDAIARLHRFSGGIPRALNNAATAALVAAAAEGKALVDDACAKAAVAELTRE